MMLLGLIQFPEIPMAECVELYTTGAPSLGLFQLWKKLTEKMK